MALSFAGNGTITGLSVGGLPDGTVDADTLASGVGGKCLQVVSTNLTDVTATTASSTYADLTGLSVAITPAATSSKILCVAQISFSGSSAPTYGAFRLVRDSTAIGIGSAAGSKQAATTGGVVPATHTVQSVHISYLDSPSTTSAVTYKIQWSSNSGTLYVNRSYNESDAANHFRLASTITVMEISA